MRNLVKLNDQIQHVISFSGGKDSTAMLLMMIEKNLPIDRIICIDTTKEFPQMYNHIEKVKEYIKPYKVETFKLNFDYLFSEHIKKVGINKGSKGYGWPRDDLRWCTNRKTVIFKQNVYTYKKRKIINYDKIIEYHGIAYDEKHRCLKNHNYAKTKNRNIQYPLVDWKIFERQALEYCYSKGFDWEGLYQNRNRCSCFCCPLQTRNDLRHIYNKHPELWKIIQEMDKKTNKPFKSECTIDQLTKWFECESRTPSLF